MTSFIVNKTFPDKDKFESNVICFMLGQRICRKLILPGLIKQSNSFFDSSETTIEEVCNTHFDSTLVQLYTALTNSHTLSNLAAELIVRAPQNLLWDNFLVETLAGNQIQFEILKVVQIAYHEGNDPTDWFNSVY